MNNLPRRAFLTGSLGGISTLALANVLAAKDKETAKPSDKKTELPLPKGSSLFLTWWTDPTTTMVIQWVAPREPNALVFVSELASDDWGAAAVVTKPFPDTDHVVHRCELSGLRPDTEYRFCLQGHRTIHRFRTMPAKANNIISFVSGGDCGTGKSAISTNILAAKQEPYFAFLGGDLAYDNGRSPATFLTFLQNYSRHMIDPQGRMIPMLSCIGNHEVNGKYAPHYLSVFDGLFAQATYGVIDIGDYLSLVVLDTGHLAPVKGAQTAWLETALKEREQRPHLLVANHVPAYPSFRSYETTGSDSRKYWCPLFEKFNVDIVLEHHDHTYKRTHRLTDGLKDRNGVLYMGDGSWGQLRPIHKPEDRPYLATWSQANHLMVHRLEGDQRFHIALEGSGKVADVCSSFGKRPARRA